MDETVLTLQPIMAALAALALALLLIPLARSWGWMDHPGTRKRHHAPTPLVGGVAIYAAAALVLAWTGLPGLGPLGLATAIILGAGLLDDRWPQTVKLRFALQIVACLVMVYWGANELRDFGRLMWDERMGLGPLAVPITVFAALGVINAMNMIDGLDGLCGSVFLVCCAALALLAARAGAMDSVQLLLVAGGAVFGYLTLNARWPWNRRARIFLGDAGSALLGFFLAWMFIDLGNGPDRAFAPMTAVWIIGIPLLDTTRLMGRRWLAGGSAFAPDRFHLHHAFLRAGFSTGQTLAGVVGLCAAFAAVGVVTELRGVPEYWRFYAYVAFGLVYLWVMRNVWRHGRFLGRSFEPAGPVVPAVPNSH